VGLLAPKLDMGRRGLRVCSRPFCFPRRLGRARCASDSAASPALILGHLLHRGLTMALTNAHIVAAQFLGLCCAAGFIAGLLVTGTRIMWETWHG
jgi:hypothetical protein